jgi:predicted Zn finger-like uncharacterized protein
MYTQCPECGTAFRVTAEALRKAAGKVRCGSCGSAFNALDFLSEQKPVTPAAPQLQDEPTRPPPEPPRLEADEPLQSVSVEPSAALLKTLDELAGPDIRIEDTGVEWRVLGADDEEDEAPDTTDDTDSMRWFIDQSPTPVDEQLSAEPGAIDAPEIFEPENAPGETAEMRFDDDTPLPEDFEFDGEPTESGPGVEIEVGEEPMVPDIAQADLELGEPEDWEDLLGEVAEEAEHRETGELEAVDEQEEEPLPDVDTQFATQAEAMGIDLSGIHARSEQPEGDAADESTIDAEAEVREVAENREEPNAQDDDVDFDELELDIEEPDDLLEPHDRELVARSDEDATLAAELGVVEDDNADDDEVEVCSEGRDDDRPEHVIPPMTEEEQTINMMIDQDLLAIAVEDEEGFASTIIQKQRPEYGERQEDRDEDESADEASAEYSEQDSPQFETIIMEGEFVRDAFEEERLKAQQRQATDADVDEEKEDDGGESDKDQMREAKAPRNYRMAAGVAALALLLGAQYVHQARESLAVYPAFSSSVGSIYRMIGKPVTPAWNITGWRFEATKGSTDESDEVLTIYSRIGNKSREALPYPLINVSLTDRFDDIIGSKVLEPGEYLTESLDTRKPVQPGETFSAVISIEAPDVSATGFKLNVCYRQPGGRLRCAIEDFR